MKTITTLTLLFISTFCKSQCKYDKNEYDQFLKKQKIEKSIKVKGGDQYLKLNFCNYDSFVFFRINYVTNRGMVVGKRDALIFLLDDESTVTAYPNDIYSSKSWVLSVSVREILDATYYFEGDWSKLKTQKVKSVRIYYNSVYSDINIKHSKELQGVINCF